MHLFAEWKGADKVGEWVDRSLFAVFIYLLLFIMALLLKIVKTWSWDGLSEHVSLSFLLWSCSYTIGCISLKIFAQLSP